MPAIVRAWWVDAFNNSCRARRAFQRHVSYDTLAREGMGIVEQARGANKGGDQPLLAPRARRSLRYGRQVFPFRVDSRRALAGLLPEQPDLGTVVVPAQTGEVVLVVGVLAPRP